MDDSRHPAKPKDRRGSKGQVARRASRSHVSKPRTSGITKRAPLPFALSSKLLFLTILFVMISEVLIYVPSVANFRNTWLQDRLGDAETAALVLSAAPDGMVPRNLELDLLNRVGAKTVAVRQGGVRRLIALSDMPPPVDETVDFRAMSPTRSIEQSFALLVRTEPQMIRVVAPLGEVPGDFVEVVMDDRALRRAMLGFSRNILTLSLIISGITALLVYLSLNRLLVRPMRDLTETMIAFSKDPENPKRVISPSRRRDEIGIAETELASMQKEVQSALHQKARLAALGLAVSKINHDLRNILASAQLISDRLGTLPDPTVQRFAPKLISTLDRAIDFCTSSLKFGSAQEAEPQRRQVHFRPIVDEVYETLGLEWRDTIGWKNTVDPDLQVDVDPEQIVRVLLNLARNSIQALEAEGTGDPDRDLVMIAAARTSDGFLVEISDTGPGIPAKARQHLFEAFRGSARPGGTGLGLAIAAEIVRAHGGEIKLVDGGVGARFQFLLPSSLPFVAGAPSAPAKNVAI